MPSRRTAGEAWVGRTIRGADGEEDGREPASPRDWATIYLDGDSTIGDVLGRFPLQEADRDDCRQRIWEEVLATRLSGFRGGNLRAWFAALARNKAIDALRKRRDARGSLTFDVASEASGGDPDARATAGDRARALVWRALAELDDRSDPRSYLVFYLHWIEGWPICQAGEVLGLQPGQARLRHHRFKKKFREVVEALAG